MHFYLRYTTYWKERLKTVKLDDVCFKINTNTGVNDKGNFFLNEYFHILILIKY
jgi:hypothetical protein